MQAYTKNSVLSKNEDEQNALSRGPITETQVPGVTIENLVDLADVSNAISARADGGADESAVPIDRTPESLRFEGSLCEDEPVTLGGLAFDVPPSLAGGLGRKTPGANVRLEPCPPPRGGVHRWLMRAANTCYKAGLTPNEAVHELETRMTRPPSPVKEIEQAVAKVYDSVPEPHSMTWTSTPKWPAVNQEQRAVVIASGLGLADLHHASRFPCGGLFPQTEQIIDELFPDNPLLCVGRSKWDFATRHRETFRGHLSRFQLIVPNPMAARLGKAQAGHLTEHSLAATGERHYLVVEQDSGTLDEQAAIVLHLAERAPLVLALRSGSKSLHAWFFCKGQPEDRLLSFMRNAVVLGADEATWSRSQFVRMPDALRDNGRRQAVVFFNLEGVKL